MSVHWLVGPLVGLLVGWSIGNAFVGGQRQAGKRLIVVYKHVIEEKKALRIIIKVQIFDCSNKT